MQIRNRPTYIENKHMVTKEERKELIRSLELTDRHTLLYIKQITSKNLLYTPGNYTQCFIIAYNGKESGKEYIHIYILFQILFWIHIHVFRTYIEFIYILFLNTYIKINVFMHTHICVKKLRLQSWLCRPQNSSSVVQRRVTFKPIQAGHYSGSPRASRPPPGHLQASVSSGVSDEAPSRAPRTQWLCSSGHKH